MITAEKSQLSVVSCQSERLVMINADVIDGLRRLPEKSVQCVVTSPPYWGLRSYLPKGHPLKHLEIGQEKSVDCGRRSISSDDGTAENGASRQQRPTLCWECYVCKMVAVFREVWRVLRDDGTVWLNLGDTYNNCGTGGNGATGGRDKSTLATQMPPIGTVPTKRDLLPNLKPKDLVMVPFRVAMALQAEGWYVRSDIVWAKPNCMPESVTDRPTRSHEYIFLLAKSARYFYDAEAIREAPSPDLIKQIQDGYSGAALKDYLKASVQDASATKSRVIQGYRNRIDKQRGHGRRHNGFNDKWDALTPEEQALCGRNKRDVWTVAPANFPEAHFATFPPELIKPCILAGTSAAGCCARCGAPVRRMVEQNLVPTAKACRRNLVDARDISADPQDQGSNRQKDGHVPGMVRADKTVGWEPTCKCKKENAPASGDPKAASLPPHSIVPCTVLDPFGGSGTTGEVALELGRRAILIELNPEYMPLIERRTAITPGLPI